MQYRIVKSKQMASAETVSGTHQASDIDKLLITVVNPVSANKFTASHAQNTRIVATFREHGIEKNIFRCNFLDLLKYTDFKGGFSYDSTGTDLSIMTALVDIGNMDFSSGETLNIDFTPPAASFDAGVLVSITGIKSSDVVKGVVKSYESFALSSDYNPTMALELYNMSSPSNQDIDIRDIHSGYTVNDVQAKALALTVANLERNVDFGMLWQDKLYQGSNLTVKAASGTNLFCVKVAQ